MNDIEQARERRKRERDKDHWTNDRADITAGLWVNEEGEIICHELTVLHGGMGSGEGRVRVIETLSRGVGRIGVSIANDAAESGIPDPWKCEPVLTGVITRSGTSFTMQHAWFIDESKPGLWHRVKAARWLLRRVWVIVVPTVRIALELAFRPNRLRNLPRR